MKNLRRKITKNNKVDATIKKTKKLTLKKRLILSSVNLNSSSVASEESECS